MFASVNFVISAKLVNFSSGFAVDFILHFIYTVYPASLNLRTSEAKHSLRSWILIFTTYTTLYTYSVSYIISKPDLWKKKKGRALLRYLSSLFSTILSSFITSVIQEKESSKLKFATREHTQLHGRTYTNHHYLCRCWSRTNRHTNHCCNCRTERTRNN